MATKAKERNSIRYSWQPTVYQGNRVGLYDEGMRHWSPVFPALVGAELTFSYDGAPHGGLLLVEMTPDSAATSPWHSLIAENIPDKRGEISATIPPRVTDSEWSGAPVFIRCYFGVSTPPPNPAAMRLAEENGWPYESPRLDGEHPVTLSLEVKEDS
jgi:hypothetical protein